MNEQVSEVGVGSPTAHPLWVTVADALSDEAPIVITAHLERGELDSWAQGILASIVSELAAELPVATPSRDDFNPDMIAGWNLCRDYLFAILESS